MLMINEVKLIFFLGCIVVGGGLEVTQRDNWTTTVFCNNIYSQKRKRNYCNVSSLNLIDGVIFCLI